MEYNMTVKIQDAKTEEGMNSTIVLKLKAQFSHDPEDYGNGHYLSIRSVDRSFENVYDLRYDKTFKKKEKMTFLMSWAENYWNGENGAYELTSCNIEKA